MGRKTKWLPRVLTPTDILRGEVIIRKYTAKKNHQIVRRYKRFCFLNCCSEEAGLQPWIGQMRTDGMSPGTVDTYLQTVVRASPVLSRSRSAASILRAVAAYHSHKGGRTHAPDIAQKTATTIFRQVKKKSPDFSCDLWVMIVSGLRPACIANVDHRDFALVARRFLKVKVRFGKGVRKTRKRREVSYPLSGLPPPPKTWKSMMAKKSYPLTCTANKMNKVLAEACKTLKIKRVTCGTFRRLFCKRIVPYCKKTGVSVSSMMIHQSEDMVGAHYNFDA